MLVVVPFRAGGKSRLPVEIRSEVALAMLGDVVEAAVEVGEVRVVTSDAAGQLVATELGAIVVDDPGRGQGPAVAAALDGGDGICVVVNADLPCVSSTEIETLSLSPRLGRVAIAEALDGTTNALGLPAPEVFHPLYGPDSAERFRERAAELGLRVDELGLPGLVADVDDLADLARIELRRGSRTGALLEAIPL